MDELVQEAHGRVGSQIGKYRLDAVLGVGGTAAVYAGTHRNGNRVAIKVLHAQFSADEAMRGRFLREGYVANKVDHPGTVRVLDDESSSDITYLVMDLLEGETLEARSTRIGGKLPPFDVVHHGIGLLEVLERAHAASIVHRDIKPENVFLTKRQELKVLDFGIARLRDANSVKTKATQMGTMMGTPAYLAPEQALGNLNDIDGRTDVWAVGATLFTLLTGHHVHQGRSAQEALVFASTRPAPPIKQFAPQVPDALAQIIDRALRFRREERFQTAVEMKKALIATGLARVTVPLAVSPPLARRADLSRQAPTIMTSTTGARSGSSTSIALAGALFGLVTLGGIFAGLLVLKHRREAEQAQVTVEPTAPSAEPAPSASVSSEPEIEQLPLPSAEPAPTLDPPPMEAAVEAGALVADEPIEKPKPIAAPKPVVPAPSASEAKDPWDPR